MSTDLTGTPTPERRYLVNVETAILRGDQYLMIVRGEQEEHAPGLLSFPGGVVEPEERDLLLEVHAVREVTEEVAVRVRDLWYVESKSFRTDSGELVLDVVFAGTYDGGDPVPQEEEVAEVLWMTAADILSDTRTPPWIAQSVRKIEDRRRS